MDPVYEKYFGARALGSWGTALGSLRARARVSARTRGRHKEKIRNTELPPVKPYTPGGDFRASKFGM